MVFRNSKYFEPKVFKNFIFGKCCTTHCTALSPWPSSSQESWHPTLWIRLGGSCQDFEQTDRGGQLVNWQTDRLTWSDLTWPDLTWADLTWPPQGLLPASQWPDPGSAARLPHWGRTQPQGLVLPGQVQTANITITQVQWFFKTLLSK